MNKISKKKYNIQTIIWLKLELGSKKIVKNFNKLIYNFHKPPKLNNFKLRKKKQSNHATFKKQSN